MKANDLAYSRARTWWPIICFLIFQPVFNVVRVLMLLVLGPIPHGAGTIGVAVSCLISLKTTKSIPLEPSFHKPLLHVCVPADSDHG